MTRMARHCIMLHAAEAEGGASAIFEQEAGIIRLDPRKARCHEAPCSHSRLLLS